ncbi:MAG: hypothetical protein JO359_03870 [Candidatus Eremiobacteraeota bacterium]|nr:hypothetical protein [Candidatus Eremiobacteraeota bacterium]
MAPAATGKDGEKLTIEIASGTNNQPNEQAEVQIQSRLRAIGIAVSIRNYPVNLLFARNGPLYTGKYDTEWSTDTFGPDPDNEALWSGKFIPPKGANTSWIDDPTINETSSAQVRTFDRAKRKALVQKEEARIHELVPAIFLYWENAYAAYNDDLKNYKPAQYIASSWNAWEWEI